MHTGKVTDYQALAQRYVELWNGDDDDSRRLALANLFTDEGEHVAPSIAVRGHEQLEARVVRSHRRWVVEERCRFRMRSAAGHHNLARVIWEMVDASGAVESVGTDVLVLDEAGKIASAYQFIDEHG